MYIDLFNLIHSFIYGGVELTPDMNLVCTLIATLGCIFCVAIPFICVYKVICFVCSAGSSWR